MKCPNCGAEVEGKFCTCCGTKLPEQPVSEPVNDPIVTSSTPSTDSLTINTESEPVVAAQPEVASAPETTTTAETTSTASGYYQTNNAGYQQPEGENYFQMNNTNTNLSGESINYQADPTVVQPEPAASSVETSNGYSAGPNTGYSAGPNTGYTANASNGNAGSSYGPTKSTYSFSGSTGASNTGASAPSGPAPVSPAGGQPKAPKNGNSQKTLGIVIISLIVLVVILIVIFGIRSCSSHKKPEVVHNDTKIEVSKDKDEKTDKDDKTSIHEKDDREEKEDSKSNGKFEVVTGGSKSDKAETSDIETEAEVGTDDYDAAAVDAADYLNALPFSYSGLISQLEWEGYSTEVATYAVDTCGADWSEQAVLAGQMALQYLDSDLSAEELYDYMIADGFTEDEAYYALEVLGY